MPANQSTRACPTNFLSELKLGVIILGAGASSRMGRPKLLLPWGETSIIGALLNQWEQLGALQIVVVCRRGDDLLNRELDRLHFPRTNRIKNPQPERGMFSSILCAAQWPGWHREVSSWAIALGDQPHLRTKTLRMLLDFHRAHPQSICQPTHAGHGCHPVLLRQTSFTKLRGTQDQTLDQFLKRQRDQSIQCPLDDAGLLLDLDTPEQYDRTFAGG